MWERGLLFSNEVFPPAFPLLKPLFNLINMDFLMPYSVLHKRIRLCIQKLQIFNDRHRFHCLSFFSSLQPISKGHKMGFWSKGGTTGQGAQVYLSYLLHWEGMEEAWLSSGGSWQKCWPTWKGAFKRPGTQNSLVEKRWWVTKEKTKKLLSAVGIFIEYTELCHTSHYMCQYFYLSGILKNLQNSWFHSCKV